MIKRMKGGEKRGLSKLVIVSCKCKEKLGGDDGMGGVGGEEGVVGVA